MGFEYKLSVQNPDGAALTAALHDLPGVREVTPMHYEVRDPPSTDAMPDAELSIESYGLYFCCNGSRRREFLGILVDRMTTLFDSVVVEEL